MVQQVVVCVKVFRRCVFHLEYKPQVISKPNIDRTISVDEASSSDDEVQVVCEE